MRIELNITGLAEVRQTLRALGTASANRAMRMAVNKVADKGRTEVNRAVRERYAIQADQVRNSLDVVRAQSGRLEAVIRVFGSPSKRGRSANVIRFAERKVSLAEMRRRRKAGTERGLRFKFLRSGAAKIIPGAFIGNQGRTVFRRVGKGRFPIEPVQVIGVSQMFRQREIEARVRRRIETEFDAELRRAIAQVLRAKGGA